MHQILHKTRDREKTLREPKERRPLQTRPPQGHAARRRGGLLRPRPGALPPRSCRAGALPDLHHGGRRAAPGQRAVRGEP